MVTCSLISTAFLICLITFGLAIEAGAGKFFVRKFDLWMEERYKGKPLILDD